MTALDETTLFELCEKARALSAERTDGSQAALYLLVERMRPMLTELTNRFIKMSDEMLDITRRQDLIEEEFESLRAERDALQTLVIAIGGPSDGPR